LFPRKLPELNVWSRRRSGIEFHELGAATEKALWIGLGQDVQETVDWIEFDRITATLRFCDRAYHFDIN